MNWEKIGIFGVDAGLCWIGDPCYLSDGRGPMQNWDAFCKELDRHDKHPLDRHDKHPGAAQFYQFDQGLAVHTGYGDGTYPVYVKRSKEGRILGMLISFDASIENESEIDVSPEAGDSCPDCGEILDDEGCDNCGYEYKDR